MPYDAPPDLAVMSLLDIANAVGMRKLPPLKSWKPKETADSHMRIAADGRWFHEGRQITRPAMIRAFVEPPPVSRYTHMAIGSFFGFPAF